MSITDALKTDIALTGGDFVQTSGGDLATQSGLANLKTALFHRLMTVPGSLIHRPLYGVGVGLFQNGLSSFSLQQKLATIIRDQFSQDPRVQSIGTTAVVTNDLQPQLTIIKVFVKPIGYIETEMHFTPFNEGFS